MNSDESLKRCDCLTSLLFPAIGKEGSDAWSFSSHLGS